MQAEITKLAAWATDLVESIVEHESVRASACPQPTLPGLSWLDFPGEQADLPAVYDSDGGAWPTGRCNPVGRAPRDGGVSPAL